MKILILTNHFQRSDGVAQSLLSLCNYLSTNEEFNITVLPLYEIKQDFAKDLSNTVRIQKGIGFYFRGLDRIVSLCPVRLLRKCFKIPDDYDVEVAYQSGLPTKIVGSKLSTNNKKKVKVIWIHGFTLWMNEFMEADIVVCISDWAKQKLTQILPELKTTKVCHNLVNEEKILNLGFKSCDVALSKRGITLITVSRLSKEKGIARFLNILAELKNKNLSFTYLIVGDGPEKRNLQKLISHHKLENVVKLLGEKSNPYSYIKFADLYVCPSYSEGYSTVCVEASILGVPILTTDVPGAKEIIQTAEAGMVVPNNEQGLKTGLLTIIQDKELLNNWSKKLTITAKRFFRASRQKEVDCLFGEIKKELMPKKDKLN